MHLSRQTTARHHSWLLVALLLAGGWACKQRLPAKGGAEAPRAQGAADSESDNRRNLLAGLSMVTQGAIQGNNGNPEAYGLTEPRNFDSGQWGQSFKTLDPSGLFDIQSTEDRKDTVTWQWKHDGKTMTGTYVLDRRAMGGKRFLLVRLCKLDAEGSNAPELMSFCGIAGIDGAGQINRTWTLCSGFTPDCPSR